MATDVYKEWLREMELLRNPGSKERSYETEDKRNKKPTAVAAADGIADSAANRCDDDVDQEFCRCHGSLLLFVVILVIFIWDLLFGSIICNAICVPTSSVGPGDFLLHWHR